MTDKGRWFVVIRGNMPLILIQMRSHAIVTFIPQCNTSPQRRPVNIGRPTTYPMWAKIHDNAHPTSKDSPSYAHSSQQQQTRGHHHGGLHQTPHSHVENQRHPLQSQHSKYQYHSLSRSPLAQTHHRPLPPLPHPRLCFSFYVLQNLAYSLHQA